jgi:dTDP-glucose pyrophosphorylase
MINVVIPMAGLGSRFASVGYSNPKPFIEVEGKPMIIRVLENLKIEGAKYYLIARKEHLQNDIFLVDKIEKEYNVKFIAIDKLTEGTACTVLFARKYINNSFPLLIANSDQLIGEDINQFIQNCQQINYDGSILTFIESNFDNKWSYAKLDQNGLVQEVKEKVAISNTATVGIYYFSKGSDFIDYAVDMIIENDRVNNEFYTCPVYNYAIRDGKKISIFNIPKDQMHGIGTPEDLNIFLDNDLRFKVHNYVHI